MPRVRAATWALFAGLAALVLWTFRDFGITADEPTCSEYGRMLLNYYGSGGRDTTFLRYWDWRYYGGLYEPVVAWISRSSPLGLHETRNLVNAGVGLLGIAGCRAAAARLAGPRAGLFAAALLALIPLYAGQMFTNSKDVPFAAAYIWAVVLMLRAADRFPRVPAGLAVGAGAAIGAAMGLRVGGVMLLGYYALAVAVGAWVARRHAARLAGTFAVTATTAYLVMLAAWPFAQLAPVRGPLEALRIFGHFNYPFPVLFGGRMVLATDLPRSYLPVYLALTVPEGLWLLVALAAGLGVARVARGRVPSAVVIRYALVAAAAAAPCAAVVVLHPTLYNGMRHLIFVLPPLACLAGVALDAALARAALRPVVAAAGVLLVLPAVEIVRLHPYEYTYVNRLGGGLGGAAGVYELDPMAEAVSGASAWLMRYLAERPGLVRRPIRIWACPSGMAASYYFTDRMAMVKDPARADYRVETPSPVCGTPRGGRLLYRIEREGVPFASVMAAR